MLIWKDGKGPAEQAPFDLDWSLRLAGEAIISSSWTVTAGDGALIIVSQKFSAGMAQVMLSGGTLGVIYELQNIVATATCPELTEKVQLPIRNR